MEANVDRLDSDKKNYDSHANNENKKRDIKTKGLIYFILACLWIGIVYGGYIYAKNYLDTAINDIRQENAMNIKEIKESITLVSSETSNLRASMQDAGMVISSTSDVQSRIDEKLLDLESQLKELEKSLQVLQEAPHDPKN